MGLLWHCLVPSLVKLYYCVGKSWLFVLVFLFCVLHFGALFTNHLHITLMLFTNHTSINSCIHESEKSTNLKELAGERSRKRQACLVIGGIIIVSVMSFIPYVDWAGKLSIFFVLYIMIDALTLLNI